jgi:hypothetical protein
MRAFQPLQVVGYIASRRGDAERGPLVRVRPEDARMRLIDDGELVWVWCMTSRCPGAASSSATSPASPSPRS